MNDTVDAFFAYTPEAQHTPPPAVTAYFWQQRFGVHRGRDRITKTVARCPGAPPFHLELRSLSENVSHTRVSRPYAAGFMWDVKFFVRRRRCAAEYLRTRAAEGGGE